MSQNKGKYIDKETTPPTKKTTLLTRLCSSILKFKGDIRRIVDLWFFEGSGLILE
jgi:hypothetical protein